MYREIEQAENSATFHAAEDILHTAEEENAYIIFTETSRVSTLHPGLYKRLREGA